MGTSEKEEEGVGITNINPLNHTITEIINEVNEQILRDIRIVMNTVLPENIRTQIIEILQPFIKVGKQSIDVLMDMFLRYANVLINTVKDEVFDKKKLWTRK